MELTNFIRKYIHIILIVAASVVLCACGNNRSYDQGELDRIKQMYAQAAGAQKAGDYDKALKLYDQLLHQSPRGQGVYGQPHAHREQDYNADDEHHGEASPPAGEISE